MTIHEEIAKTEDAARRLPPELRGDVVKDADARLAGWSAKNLMTGVKRKKAKPDPNHS
jgi:hypothetical protein